MPLWRILYTPCYLRYEVPFIALLPSLPFEPRLTVANASTLFCTKKIVNRLFIATKFKTDLSFVIIFVIIFVIQISYPCCKVLEDNRAEMDQMLEAAEQLRASRPPGLPIPASAQVLGQAPDAAVPLCALQATLT